MILRSIFIFITVFTFKCNLQSQSVNTTTLTIKVKPIPYKKAICEIRGNYILYFDANTYLNTLTIDSVFDSTAEKIGKAYLKEKLTGYYSKKDTIVLSRQAEKEINAFIVNPFNKYRSVPLENGEVYIYNMVTKKPEKELYYVCTVKLDVKTIGKTERRDGHSDIKILSMDQKQEFYTMATFYLSQETKR